MTTSVNKLDKKNTTPLEVAENLEKSLSKQEDVLAPSYQLNLLRLAQLYTILEQGARVVSLLMNHLGVCICCLDNKSLDLQDRAIRSLFDTLLPLLEVCIREENHAAVRETSAVIYKNISPKRLDKELNERRMRGFFYHAVGMNYVSQGIHDSALLFLMIAQRDKTGIKEKDLELLDGTVASLRDQFEKTKWKFTGSLFSELK